MSSKTFVLVVVWIVCTLLWLNFAFSLINYPNTVANVLGTGAIVGYAVLSEKSRLFTSNPFKSTKKSKK